MSALTRQRDLPAGGARMIRRPEGVHGVSVNSAQIHDGTDYIPLESGPWQGLTKFVQ